MSWVQRPTQSGPYARRLLKKSVRRLVAWSASGSVHSFPARSENSCSTTRGCAMRSAGPYSIADWLARTTATAQHSVQWTAGIRRRFRAVFWLRFSLLPSIVHARPTRRAADALHTRLTLAVRLNLECACPCRQPVTDRRHGSIVSLTRCHEYGPR